MFIRMKSHPVELYRSRRQAQVTRGAMKRGYHPNRQRQWRQRRQTSIQPGATSSAFMLPINTFVAVPIRDFDEVFLIDFRPIHVDETLLFKLVQRVLFVAVDVRLMLFLLLFQIIVVPAPTGFKFVVVASERKAQEIAWKARVNLGRSHGRKSCFDHSRSWMK